MGQGGAEPKADQLAEPPARAGLAEAATGELVCLALRRRSCGLKGPANRRPCGAVSADVFVFSPRLQA